MFIKIHKGRERNRKVSEAQKTFANTLNQNIGDAAGKGGFAIARVNGDNEVNITLEESTKIGNTEYKPFDIDAYLKGVLRRYSVLKYANARRSSVIGFKQVEICLTRNVFT